MIMAISRHGTLNYIFLDRLRQEIERRTETQLTTTIAQHWERPVVMDVLLLLCGCGTLQRGAGIASEFTLKDGVNMVLVAVVSSNSPGTRQNTIYAYRLLPIF